MSRLTLFGTEGCHLCEEAQAILQRLSLPFDIVDICDTPAHVRRYGETIPVVRTPRGNELNWPFDESALTEFLK